MDPNTISVLATASKVLGGVGVIRWSFQILQKFTRLVKDIPRPAQPNSGFAFPSGYTAA